MRYIYENPRRSVPFVWGYAIVTVLYAGRVMYRGMTPPLLAATGLLLLLLVLLCAHGHYHVNRKSGTALFKLIVIISGIFALGQLVVFTFTPEFDGGRSFAPAAGLVGALVGGTIP